MQALGGWGGARKYYMWSCQTFLGEPNGSEKKKDISRKFHSECEKTRQPAASQEVEQLPRPPLRARSK